MERVAYGERKRHSVGDGVMCQEDERCIVPALDEHGARERRLIGVEPRCELLAGLDLPALARILGSSSSTILTGIGAPCSLR